MPAATVGTFLVFLMILLALVLFVTEPVPIDVTAVGVMVTLIVFAPWMGISQRDDVSRVANLATSPILALMILSDKIRRTGVIQRLEKIDVSYRAMMQNAPQGLTRWIPDVVSHMNGERFTDIISLFWDSDYDVIEMGGTEAVGGSCTTAGCLTKIRSSIW